MSMALIEEHEGSQTDLDLPVDRLEDEEDTESQGQYAELTSDRLANEGMQDLNLESEDDIDQEDQAAESMQDDDMHEKLD